MKSTAILIRAGTMGVCLTLTGIGWAQAPKGKSQEFNSQSPPQLTRRVTVDADNSNAPLLFCVGMHIEPFGATVSTLVRPEISDAPPRRPGPSYFLKPFFERHLDDIRTVALIVERHGGRMTVQAQTPFTRLAAESGDKILAELEKQGHEIALHFHEDAHLGRGSERLDTATWAAVMTEEVDWLKKAGAHRIQYWSGGNLFPGVLDAAARVGLSVMSDHKNPRRQQTDSRLLAVNPWRPAGGPAEDKVDAFVQHDPKGKIIYLPDGIFSRVDHASMRRSPELGGEWRYFDFLTEGLELSLRAARPDRVNVFHFTVHAGEFRGPARRPFAVIDAWLGEVLEPLVKAGKVKWATFSEMGEQYARWEQANPEIDPRGDSTRGVGQSKPTIEPSKPAPKPAVSSGKNADGRPGYITFAVNAHDWHLIQDSADTLKRLLGIFQKYNVRADFYFTAPVVESYVEHRPEMIEQFKQSDMTISYHVRGPHPLWRGFSRPLEGKTGGELAKVLRDYETYQLNLATGELNRDKPGGYAYVAQVFGRKPVAVGASDAAPNVKAVSCSIYSELGAQAGVFYHESGTRLDHPFEFQHGLLVRPSDFSVTRFEVLGRPQGVFWWNRVGTPREAEFDPLVSLQQQLGKWKGNRAPFITVLIHENDFYREGGPGWNSIYFDGQGPQERPRRPPFDLSTPPRSTNRTAQTRDAIFQKYEQLVAYAAQHLMVVTSQDIVTMAKADKNRR